MSNTSQTQPESSDPSVEALTREFGKLKTGLVDDPTLEPTLQPSLAESSPKSQREGPSESNVESKSTVYTPSAHQSTLIDGICGPGHGISERPHGFPQVATKLPSCELPKFNGQNFELFLDKFARFLRLSNMLGESDEVKCDWLIQAAEPSTYGMFSTVCKTSHKNLNLALKKLSQIYPSHENDLTVRKSLSSMQQLPYQPSPQLLAEFFLKFDDLMSKLSVEAMSNQEKLLLVTGKIHPKTLSEMRSNNIFRRRTEKFPEICEALREKVHDDWTDRTLGFGVTSSRGLNILSSDPPTESSPTFGSPQPAHVHPGKGKGKGKGPVQGKGKGKGKGQRSRSQSREPPNRFTASVMCKHCGRKGHYEATCWDKFPKLRPKRNPSPGPSSHRRPSFPENNRSSQSWSSPSWSPPSRPSTPRSTPTSNFEENENNSKKRKVAHLLHLTSALYLDAIINNQPAAAVIDSGASVSFVAEHLVDPRHLNRHASVPVQVANGETIWTLGKTNIAVTFNEKQILHPALVLPTRAFEAVLGLDFLSTPPCKGLMTSPTPFLLLRNGDEIPLKKYTNQMGSAFHVFKVTKVFRNESYTLITPVRIQCLLDLGVNPLELSIDLFANNLNHIHDLFLTRSNNAFLYDWNALSENGALTLLANPPFSQLPKVVSKICLEPCRMVLVTPVWKSEKWYQILEKIAIQQVFVEEDTPLYQSDDRKILPSPKWQTVVSLIDTTKRNVPFSSLEPIPVKFVQGKTQGWGRENLNSKVQRLYGYSADTDASMQTDPRDFVDSTVP